MEHFEPFTPTEEQAKNNPNKYWEGFLGQKVKLIAEKLKQTGNVGDPDVAKILDDVLEDVPKNKADFISKDEMLIRGLELYARENGGFANEKLKKAYVEKLAPFLAGKLSAYEFDTIDQELQKEIAKLQKTGILGAEDLQKFRENFGGYFSDLKMKEYEEELNSGGKE